LHQSSLKSYALTSRKELFVTMGREHQK